MGAGALMVHAENAHRPQNSLRLSFLALHNALPVQCVCLFICLFASNLNFSLSDNHGCCPRR
jgi:hypothetical protein